MNIHHNTDIVLYNSAFIAWFRYITIDVPEPVLHVVFRTGVQYQFTAIPSGVILRLYDSNNKAKYLYDHIIRVFPGSKMPETLSKNTLLQKLTKPSYKWLAQ